MKTLWIPSKDLKTKSNLFKFEKFIYKRHKINFNFDYNKILNWSIKNSPDFWDAIWDTNWDTNILIWDTLTAISK